MRRVCLSLFLVSIGILLFIQQSEQQVWAGTNFGAGLTWTQTTAAAQWARRMDHTSLIYNDKMWVIGGNSGTNKNDTWYSTDGMSWTQQTAAAQFAARSAHTSLVYNNKMWMIGGGRAFTKMTFGTPQTV